MQAPGVKAAPSLALLAFHNACITDAGVVSGRGAHAAAVILWGLETGCVCFCLLSMDWVSVVLCILGWGHVRYPCVCVCGGGGVAGWATSPAA
jgi:hypothetical protein